MPGYAQVPKGAGCERCGDPVDCVSKDSPYGMPCGGAPSCDNEHICCDRAQVGCQGSVEWAVQVPPPIIRITPGFTCVTWPTNPYNFDCYGTNGHPYQICARLLPPLKSPEGHLIAGPVGDNPYCVSGTF